MGNLNYSKWYSVERKSKWIMFYDWQSLNALLIHKLFFKSHVVSLYTDPDSLDEQLSPVPTFHLDGAETPISALFKRNPSG